MSMETRWSTGETYLSRKKYLPAAVLHLLFNERLNRFSTGTDGSSMCCSEYWFALCRLSQMLVDYSMTATANWKL
jgi:hypothetical protein